MALLSTLLAVCTNESIALSYQTKRPKKKHVHPCHMQTQGTRSSKICILHLPMHLVAAHVGPLLVLELHQAVALGLAAGLVLEER